jgi:hypothetical protein
MQALNNNEDTFCIIAGFFLIGVTCYLSGHDVNLNLQVF